MEYKLDFKKTTSRYNKNDLFNNLDKVWLHLNKQPTVKDMECFPSEICFGTYYNHFGSWKNALKEFIIFKNNGNLLEVKTEIIKKEKRKDFNNALRYEIMKRDRFKCRLCGSSPATKLNTELEIDHIVSISSGGKNEIDNLQTLCRECNIGKGNQSLEPI